MRYLVALSFTFIGLWKKMMLINVVVRNLVIVFHRIPSYDERAFFSTSLHPKRTVKVRENLDQLHFFGWSFLALIAVCEWKVNFLSKFMSCLLSYQFINNECLRFCVPLIIIASDIFETHLHHTFFPSKRLWFRLNLVRMQSYGCSCCHFLMKYTQLCQLKSSIF